MSRAVFVGGFCNGRTIVEKVGKSLEGYFSDVDVFTFSDHTRKDTEIQRAAKNSTFITLSAGALALPKLVERPAKAYLLNPPLPTSVPALALKGIVKTARLYTPNKGLHSASDLSTISAFGRSTVAEFAAHPVANYGQLAAIAKFDATTAAITAKREGTDLHTVWTYQDAYFKPTQYDQDLLAEAGVTVTLLDGEHDEVILRPDNYLATVFKQTR